MNSSNKKFRVHVLQGTTGSGKTLVALVSILTAVNNQKQAALMVPTFFATYKTAGFILPFNFGVAKTNLFTLANFAGIAFINKVDGRFPGT